MCEGSDLKKRCIFGQQCMALTIVYGERGGSLDGDRIGEGSFHKGGNQFSRGG